MLISVVSIGVTVIVLGVLLNPRIQQSLTWKATVTPLASIIGSGFLVSVPLLTHTVGSWAIVAMSGLMQVAYFVGGVIRYNIRYSEPLLNDTTLGPLLSSAERLSLFTLIFAYFISVAYCLALLSAFLLNAVGITDPMIAKLLTTGLLLLITGIGSWRGLRGLEGVELIAVSFNLAIIAGLLCGLAVFNVIGDGPTVNQQSEVIGVDWHTLQVILGLLIVVQGFETSKFLGSAYDHETRVRTMRRAQWLSGAVYLAFFALVTPLMPILGAANEVTAINGLVSQVAIVLPLAVTLGAMASQFSASIADSIGASGLLHDISEKRIAIQHTYPLIGIVGALIVWEKHVNELVTLASRAFALFYASQCVVAIITAWHRADETKVKHIVGFFLMTVLCLVVVIFGTPVEA